MKDDLLMSYLLYLKLSYFREHHQSLAKEAVEKNWTQLDFLSRLIEGEALRRKDHATQRRHARSCAFRKDDEVRCDVETQ